MTYLWKTKILVRAGNDKNVNDLHLENTTEEGHDIDNYEVVITDVIPGGEGEIITRRNLVLSDEEKSHISGNHMLTDESINIAQNLLHDQFPNIHGFQDTVIGKNTTIRHY